MKRARYASRTDAGAALAGALAAEQLPANPLLLALPRGGVPVAAEMSHRLSIPFDLFFVRKLGLPGHEEFAIGAIASGGARVLHEEALRAFNVSSATIDRIVRAESERLKRYEAAFGGLHHDLRQHGIILVDDGLATGASMKVAVKAVRALEPSAIWIAVPVGSPESCAALAREVDHFVCPLMPEEFQAVGQFYDDFAQVTDDEVLALLPALNR